MYVAEEKYPPKIEVGLCVIFVFLYVYPYREVVPHFT